MPYRPPHNFDVGDLQTGTRICRHCDERKPMTAFMWASGRTSRVRTCLSCQTASRRERRKQNPDRYRQADMARRLRVQYGLTLKDYESLLEQQEGSCAICRRGLDVRDPHVDHSHATSQVRGLLCFNCNTGLGHFRDDPETLATAIQYLLRPAPLVAGRSKTLGRDELTVIWSAAALCQHASPEGQAALAKRPRGMRITTAKLTDETVTAIRRRYAAGGISQRLLAEEHSVSQRTVSQIVRRVIWTHVP